MVQKQLSKEPKDIGDHLLALQSLPQGVATKAIPRCEFCYCSEKLVLLFFLQLQSPRSSCSMGCCWREASGLLTYPTAAWASSLLTLATTSGSETAGGTIGHRSTKSLSFTSRNTQITGILCKTERWAGTWYPQQCL